MWQGAVLVILAKAVLPDAVIPLDTGLTQLKSTEWAEPSQGACVSRRLGPVIRIGGERTSPALVSRERGFDRIRSPQVNKVPAEKSENVSNSF